MDFQSLRPEDVPGVGAPWHRPAALFCLPGKGNFWDFQENPFPRKAKRLTGAGGWGVWISVDWKVNFGSFKLNLKALRNRLKPARTPKKDRATNRQSQPAP